MTENNRKTFSQVLRHGETFLREQGIQDASVDAWLLLEYVTGMTRTRFLLDRMELMQEQQQIQYEELLKKRSEHIPLQHLTGVQNFMGFSFQVNESVLIPRQDTEILVEQVLPLLKNGMQILDLCTGSGCIGISLKKLGPADLSVLCSDVSAEALLVAEKNARALAAEVILIHSDLFEALPDRYDVIVSNPPYIPTAVIKGLAEEVKLHDPMNALDGKEDGLFFYREIVRESRSHLKPDGWLAFEIGYDQGPQVAEMLEKAGFEERKIVKDLAGLDRVVLGRKPAGCE